MSKRVESSRDEDSLGKDASKHGRRINAIDADEDISLVNVQDDAEMFDVNTLTADEVFAEQEFAAKYLNLTIDEVTLAQALAALKSVKPKVKGVVIQEPSTTTKTTISSQQPSQDKGKGIMVEEPHFAAKSAEEKRNKPPTQAQQRKIMCTYLKNMEGKKPKDLKNKSFDSIQKMFDKAFKRVNTFVDFRTDLVKGSSKRAGQELEQENAKKQKVDDEKETEELKSLMEVMPDEEEVALDAIPLAVKSPSIVDWKIHKEGKKIYYQIIRADGSSKMYLVFSHMLKSFDREDLETLYKLVKAKYGSTRPVEDLDLVLYGD
ncbi:hypothetical protein Tco_1131179, partial [Tanacetum coccineum]